MNNSKITRKYERLLFRGIPEHPEHNWERNENSNVSIRRTGKAQTTNLFDDSSNGCEVWGYFEYDHDNQTEKFTTADE
jgi:hypothetical protein